LVDGKVVDRLTADLLRYLDYLFEKAFLGMTQVKRNTRRECLQSV